MTKDHPQIKEYDEINIINYLRVIKKRGSNILKIASAVFIIAVAIPLLLPSSARYSGKTVILLGTAEGKVIQAHEDVSDFLTALYPDVNIEKGKSISVLTFTMEGQDSEKVKKELTRASSAVLMQHESIITKSQARIDDQIKLLKKDLAENNERIALFNAMVNRLSPYDQAQALSLQAYLASYSNALPLKDSLEKDIQKLEQQKKLEYEKTKILTPLAISQNSAPVSIALSGTAGIILGLILGILWVFTKQWWDANKYSFK